MKKGLKISLLLSVAVMLFVVGLFTNKNAVAQLLQNTALYLRVMGTGSSAAPLAIANIDCDNGDQYYSCATYTTSNAAKTGSIRVNINGAAKYIRTYDGPV